MQDRVGMKLAVGGHLRRERPRGVKKRNHRAKKEAWLSKKSLLLRKDERTLGRKAGQQAKGRVSQERSG